MIISIESDLPTFKTVSFHEGLNVLLADKSPESGDRNTRNSAGKTSLIELIHFLLGSNTDKGSLPLHPALVQYTFRGTFMLSGETVVVRRCGSDRSKILIESGTAERLGLTTRQDRTTGSPYISNETWKEFLGHKMFGLPAQLRGSSFEESFTPSFRSMLSYFARRRSADAFSSPEKQAGAQQRWDYQVNLSYLLNLDWRVPFDLQRVRERERSLEELKKAAKGGSFGAMIGTVGELRPRVAVAEAKAAQLRDQLSRFQVVESYREFSDRAARARSEMLDIERRAVSLKEAQNHLRDALVNEQPPRPNDITRLYEAIGVELPGVAKRRFEEVERFHESVIENRRLHLQEEIEEVERQLAEGDARRAVLDDERSRILRFLEGRGALEDFVSLQQRLAELEADAASLRERFKAAELLEGETAQLNVDRANIKRRLQADHKTHGEQLDEATIIIAETIAELYKDRSGGFVVEATDNGPEFRISIEGDRGGGISNMEIFCFDLALFVVTGRRGRGPGFLIHDSHLFDGVDERQIARALSLGTKTANLQRGQYIVTMNSDIFDRLPLPANVERSKSVLSTRLSDAQASGGLFGFRFD